MLEANLESEGPIITSWKRMDSHIKYSIKWSYK